MGKHDAEKSTDSTDSVSEYLAEWMVELPGVDAAVESARQRIVGLARLLERQLASIAARHELTLGDWEALSALQRSGPPWDSHRRTSPR